MTTHRSHILTFLLTALAVFLLVAPWITYTIFLFQWPYPTDQGCYEYNCSYGININLARAWLMYSPYIDGNFISTACSAGMTTKCDGNFTANSSDTVSVLEWMLKHCYPERSGVRLFNYTPCYTGTGQANAGVDRWGMATCPYSTTCFNFDRSESRGDFLWMFPFATVILQCFSCIFISRCVEERPQYDTIDSYQA